MDYLDRLYFEFVEIMRRERPGALSEPFSVFELYEHLIPYRRVRNLVGFRSNDDYEVTLSRLLAGERDYLIADPDLQQQLRDGLAETLPEIRRYRIFPDARVWFNPEEIPPPGDTRFAPPEVRDQAEQAEQATLASAATTAKEADAPHSKGESEPTATIDRGAVAGAERSEDEATPAAPASALACPECRAERPAGALFCPYCGHRIGSSLCATCGAELEVSWQYCARCGKARDSGV